MDHPDLQACPVLPDLLVREGHPGHQVRQDLLDPLVRRVPPGLPEEEMILTTQILEDD